MSVKKMRDIESLIDKYTSACADSNLRVSKSHKAILKDVLVSRFLPNYSTDSRLLSKEEIQTILKSNSAGSKLYNCVDQSVNVHKKDKVLPTLDDAVSLYNSTTDKFTDSFSNNLCSVRGFAKGTYTNLKLFLTEKKLI